MAVNRLFGCVLVADFQSSVIFISSFLLFFFRFSFKDPINNSLFILPIVKMYFAFLKKCILPFSKKKKKNFSTEHHMVTQVAAIIKNSENDLP